MPTFRGLLARSIVSEEPHFAYEDDGESKLYIVNNGYLLVSTDDDIIDSIQLNEDGTLIVQHLSERSETFNNIDSNISIDVYQTVNIM